eukprot:m.362222 g.362222  ORF g.362222 m.362222 type:complete len:68 (-) comp20785_c0_seq53:1408-1611(-)
MVGYVGTRVVGYVCRRAPHPDIAEYSGSSKSVAKAAAVSVAAWAWLHQWDEPCVWVKAWLRFGGGVI